MAKEKEEKKEKSAKHKALVEGRDEGREEEKKMCEDCGYKHKKGEHKK